MRIRQVRPEFWSDEVVASLSLGSRLFYIGLWNVADDGGWLDWRPVQIGAVLFPYESSKRRNRDITGWTEALVEATRLVIHECGHAFIPTLTRHQRIAGNQSFAIRDAHKSVCVATRTDEVLTGSPVELGRVEERRGIARAGANGETTEGLKARVGWTAPPGVVKSVPGAR